MRIYSSSFWSAGFVCSTASTSRTACARPSSAFPFAACAARSCAAASARLDIRIPAPFGLDAPPVPAASPVPDVTSAPDALPVPDALLVPDTLFMPEALFAVPFASAITSALAAAVPAPPLPSVPDVRFAFRRPVFDIRCAVEDPRRIITESSGTSVHCACFFCGPSSIKGGIATPVSSALARIRSAKSCSMLAYRSSAFFIVAL